MILYNTRNLETFLLKRGVLHLSEIAHCHLNVDYVLCGQCWHCC